MLTVCCVCVNDYYGRGADYVNILFRAASKYLTVPHSFVCFTDNLRGIECETRPIESEGWFSKLYLFREFDEGRVIFFDLDTLIVGNIDFMAKFKGDFAILRDFCHVIDQNGQKLKRKHGQGYGSGVMLWRGGFGKEITNNYISDGKPLVVGGDQIYIENNVKKAKLIQDLYPGKVVSYKVHAYAGIPRNAAVICFHGHPKPSDFSFGWVYEAWKC